MAGWLRLIARSAYLQNADTHEIAINCPVLSILQSQSAIRTSTMRENLKQNRMCTGKPVLPQELTCITKWFAQDVLPRRSWRNGQQVSPAFIFTAVHNG